MDVSDLRKRIVRAIDEARKDASHRRVELDEAARAYESFLTTIGVPLLRQTATVLKGEGQLFMVHSPADSVRLVSEKSPETYLELALDTTGPHPQIVARMSIARGRNVHVDERPLAPGKPVAEVSEEDLASFLVKELPRVVLRP